MDRGEGALSVHAPHPAPHSKEGRDRRIQRIAHVGVVGDRAHQRHAAGLDRIDAGGDQAAGVNQHARRDAFVQSVSLEVARTFGDGNQLAGHFRIDAGFMGDDLGFDGMSG